MVRKILTIGASLAHDISEAEFDSRTSLLDWDIIIFRPVISEFRRRGDTTEYRGKPCLSDHASFALREACEHWRRELKQAFESGKTILVFLPELDEVYIANGEKSYSGSGRNQKITRIVVPYSNYTSLPVTVEPTNAHGREMKLEPAGSELLSPFWAEFSLQLEYETILKPKNGTVVATTRAGDKPVGVLYRSAISNGSLLLLPSLDFYDETYMDERCEWTSEGKAFSANMTNAVIALDKALRASSDVTPEPEWAQDHSYLTSMEKKLQADLLEAEQAVEAAQRQKEVISDKLSDEGKLRGLLYEKSKPLEASIIQALKIMEFDAQAYKEGSSEFDVVFASKEGRFLGEAEGKDAKAINVDKLRQLSMNIQEDLGREEVDSPAKAVLFGNGFRLQPPCDRDVQFTEKCITAAISLSTALVQTCDLFKAAKYIKDNADQGYAKTCRSAILSTNGIVKFPEPPIVDTVEVESSSSEY